MVNEGESYNPYVSPDSPSPYATANPLGTPAATGPGRSVPLFCTIVLVLSLILLAIRVPMVLLGLVGVFSMPDDPVIARTGLFEVLTGAAMALFGIPANILLLLRRRFGLILATVCVAATLGSILVAGAQGVLEAEALDPTDPAYHAGFLAGAAFVLIVRLALLALYVAALVVFAKRVR